MALPKLNRPPIGTPVLQVATFGTPVDVAALRHTRQWETWSDESYRLLIAMLGLTPLLHAETLTADSIITNAAPGGDGETLIVILTQDGTGGWTIVWDAAVFDGSAKFDIDSRPNISTLFLFSGIGGLWTQVSPAFSLGTGLVSPLSLVGNSSGSDYALAIRDILSGPGINFYTTVSTKVGSIGAGTFACFVVQDENDVNRVVVLQTGEVGIGVASPVEALEVDGSIALANDGDAIKFGTTGQILTNGTGSPEAVVTAVPGSIYLEDSGAVWRKDTGTGNTGWVALADELIEKSVDASAYSLTTSFADIPSCTVTLSVGFWQIVADVEILADSADGSAIVQLVLNGSANANQMTGSTTAGIVVIPASKHWDVTVGGAWVAKLQAKKNTGAGTSAVIAGIRAVRLHS